MKRSREDVNCIAYNSVPIHCVLLHYIDETISKDVKLVDSNFVLSLCLVDWAVMAYFKDMIQPALHRAFECKGVLIGSFLQYSSTYPHYPKNRLRFDLIMPIVPHNHDFDPYLYKEDYDEETKNLIIRKLVLPNNDTTDIELYITERYELLESIGDILLETSPNRILARLDYYVNRWMEHDTNFRLECQLGKRSTALGNRIYRYRLRGELSLYDIVTNQWLVPIMTEDVTLLLKIFHQFPNIVALLCQLVVKSGSQQYQEMLQEGQSVSLLAFLAEKFPNDIPSILEILDKMMMSHHYFRNIATKTLLRYLFTHQNYYASRRCLGALITPLPIEVLKQDVLLGRLFIDFLTRAVSVDLTLVRKILEIHPLDEWLLSIDSRAREPFITEVDIAISGIIDIDRYLDYSQWANDIVTIPFAKNFRQVTVGSSFLALDSRDIHDYSRLLENYVLQMPSFQKNDYLIEALTIFTKSIETYVPTLCKKCERTTLSCIWYHTVILDRLNWKELSEGKEDLKHMWYRAVTGLVIGKLGMPRIFLTKEDMKKPEIAIEEEEKDLDSDSEPLVNEWSEEGEEF